MDAFQIIIRRGVNPDGSGGTVVDDATAVIGSLPDNTPILDAMVAAFADAYGVHQVPTGNTVQDAEGNDVPEMAPVSGYRNVVYRVRLYVTELIQAYASKQAAAAAKLQTDAAINQAIDGITIVDGI